MPLPSPALRLFSTCAQTALRRRPGSVTRTALLLLVACTPVAHAQAWHLVWSDEFNAAAGTLPSSANWTYDTGNSGFGNPEIENYCIPGSGTPPCVASQPNAFQDGRGHLVIRAVRNAQGQWTSARLKTQGLKQFQYGRIEARLKLPVGNGFWPAFWMLGSNIDTVSWPQCGEQDIIEWVQSYTPTTTSSTTHGPGYSGGNGIPARFTFPGQGRIDDASFHTYGVIWEPHSLRYYRDDPSQVFLTTTPADLPAGSKWVFDQPFFLLLNLAIGSGGFPGATDSSTPATATMLVDYVRVYQASAGNGALQTVPDAAPPARKDR
jgi:beta-glucanase (GH16 family)